jgi:tetratricopeptide (TPR) repeat protein
VVPELRFLIHRLHRIFVICVSVVLFVLPGSRNLLAQAGDHTLYGDLIVDESNASGLKPLSFDVILYSEAKILVSRQSTPNNGRFRFNNLPMGLYELAIEVENNEIARISVDLRSPWLKDVRRDVELEWREPKNSARAGVLSARDTYSRSSASQKLFTSARKAAEKKQYERAAQLLQQITSGDRKDFEVWFELANVHFLQKKLAEAENEYLTAIDAHPKFFHALLNLGRLELFQKHYDVAIQVLQQAVSVQPDSADANYFLGEAFLQSRRGSSAVVYFEEALRLDPNGMAEIHLKLALLYDRAGMKDKASAEYKQFLGKKPDYPGRKKLQDYIAANKPKP